MNTKKILLFDIDGTLLLSGGAGKTALEKAVEELFGFQNAWGGMIPDGKTDPMIIDEILTPLMGAPLPSEAYAKLCDRYHDYFETEISQAEKFHLMPGIEPLLNELSRRPALALGIATGNFKRAAEMKLGRGGLTGYFAFGGFACDAAARAELTRIGYERGKIFCGQEIPPNDVIVIGDTIHDIRAGRSLGAETVAVCTGSTPKAALLAQEPDYLFDDLTDITAFLRILE